MKFSGPDGARLEVTVLGYQFPEMATEPYDSNWLNIHIVVNGPLGAWKATAPALLTYEAAKLADWLAHIADGHPTAPEWDGLEPNLSFEWRPSASKASLRAFLGAEFGPPDSARVEPLGRRHFLDFAVSRTDLTQASRSLREQLQNFPQRAAV